MMQSRHNLSRVFVLSILLLSATGCRCIYPGRLPDGPKGCVPVDAPRELCKVSIPDYIIEPPDVLAIQAIKLVPQADYQLEPLDIVNITATGLDEALPMGGEYVVQPNGTIQIGYWVGAIPAQGKTVEELQAFLLDILRKQYREPNVWVTLTQLAGQQQIAGEHLVGPDGRINLGKYGRIRVVGLTIEEATSAVESHLSQYLQDPSVAIDVVGYNSKVVYVITQGAGLGDRVFILPSRGNETVLDAIGQIQGLQSNSSTRMWIARPGQNDSGGDQIMPVDWLAVTQRGDITTNYQLMPGDRLYVSEDKLVAFDTAMGKLFAPIERVLGVTLLGTQTAQRIKFFNQPNAGFGNF